MALIEDTRQKLGKHELKNEVWNRSGVKVIRCRLPFGDYALMPKAAVDTKEGLSEIAQNLCGSVADKKRFYAECYNAKAAGVHLMFLVEEETVTCVMELYRIAGVHLGNGMVISGTQLARAMHIVSEKYGCSFHFCKPEAAGKRVIELLESDSNG
jgi:ERCC4-type nuclease